MSGSKIQNQQQLEAYLGAPIPPNPPVPNDIMAALILQYLALKEIIGNGADKPGKLRNLVLGLKDGQVWRVDRLFRLIFLRKLLGANILQLPQVANLAAFDRDWREFCVAARDASLAVRQGLALLGANFGWSMIANDRDNKAALIRLKSAFNTTADPDIPLALKICAHFGASPNAPQFITQPLLASWLAIWRKTPPGKKPIDVAFNLPKLKPHFEKHVCHLTNEAHPADECIAWMDVLQYDQKITLDLLRTYGLFPTQPHIALMFPPGGAVVKSSMPNGGTKDVPGLAKTLPARRCFVENYLCRSQQLVDSLWRDYAGRYETIAKNTLNSCNDGFLYFERDTAKIFFVGSIAANVTVDTAPYVFFVMARYLTESGAWEFSTLYMPDQASNAVRLAAFRANGHLWDGSIQ